MEKGISRGSASPSSASNIDYESALEASIGLKKVNDYIKHSTGKYWTEQLEKEEEPEVEQLSKPKDTSEFPLNTSELFNISHDSAANPLKTLEDITISDYALGQSFNYLSQTSERSITEARPYTMDQRIFDTSSSMFSTLKDSEQQKFKLDNIDFYIQETERVQDKDD